MAGEEEGRMSLRRRWRRGRTESGVSQEEVEEKKDAEERTPSRRWKQEMREMEEEDWGGFE